MSDALIVRCQNCGWNLSHAKPLPPHPDFDDERHRVCGHHVRPFEWELLALLRRHPGKLVSYDAIEADLWGLQPEPPADSRNATNVHISWLRHALRGSHFAIETVRGAGIVLRPAEDCRPPQRTRLH